MPIVRFLLTIQEVSVVGEADLLAATISRRRKFTFLHGRIVPTHDKLGVKQGMYSLPDVVHIPSLSEE